MSLLGHIEIQNIIRGYYEHLCVNKFENVIAMGKYVEKHNLLKLTQEWNNLITVSYQPMKSNS